MTEGVKDLALSLQWLGSVPGCRFNPWPGNFHMPYVQPKKKRKEKKRKTCLWAQLLNLNNGNNSNCSVNSNSKG